MEKCFSCTNEAALRNKHYRRILGLPRWSRYWSSSWCCFVCTRRGLEPMRAAQSGWLEWFHSVVGHAACGVCAVSLWLAWLWFDWRQASCLGLEQKHDKVCLLIKWWESINSNHGLRSNSVAFSRYYILSALSMTISLLRSFHLDSLMWFLDHASHPSFLLFQPSLITHSNYLQNG